MNQTQKCILLIAAEIDRICRKNEIAYSMIGGTMIGAIRLSGFIPWDDDIDFAMTRSMYKKFIEKCEEDLDARFKLQTDKIELNYAFSFCKILLKGTYCCEAFSEHASVSKGIWVDIFPLDSLPDDSFSRKSLKMRNMLLKNLIWVKCGYGEDYQKRQLRYHIYKLLGLPFSVSLLKNRREKLLNKYNELKTEEYFLSDYPHIKFRRFWFDDILDYPFETCVFCGIKNYDEYLSLQFGDYMKLPPLNQRKAHPILEVDYGPYIDL